MTLQEMSDLVDLLNKFDGHLVHIDNLPLQHANYVVIRETYNIIWNRYVDLLTETAFKNKQKNSQ